jgi:hypothetical protein
MRRATDAVPELRGVPPSGSVWRAADTGGAALTGRRAAARGGGGPAWHHCARSPGAQPCAGHILSGCTGEAAAAAPRGDAGGGGKGSPATSRWTPTEWRRCEWPLAILQRPHRPTLIAGELCGRSQRRAGCSRWCDCCRAGARLCTGRRPLRSKSSRWTMRGGKSCSNRCPRCRHRGKHSCSAIAF